MMQCPKCKYQQSHVNETCSACGLVFAKYYQYHAVNRSNRYFIEKPSWLELILPDQNQPSKSTVYGQAALLFFMAAYSLSLISAGKDSNYAGETFLHYINLPFHEAGHVIFGLFGNFIGSLGGTLGQLLIPLMCSYTFLFKQHNAFSASVSFWWFSENFIDIAPYINDARAGILPLVGGNIGKHAPYGFHDWEYLLTETGLLSYDHVIAQLSHVLGSLLMLTSIAWGALLVYKSWIK